MCLPAVGAKPGGGSYRRAMSQPAVTRPLVHPLVRLAAYFVPLCILPSAVWRAYPVLTGTFNPACSNGTAWEPYYIVSLSVVTVAAGLMTIGLVERWGEVFPGWMPLLGGRAVRPLPVVVVALIGAAIVTATLSYSVLNDIFEWRDQSGAPGCPHPFDGEGGSAVAAGYAPLLLWPPLLITVTISYYRRRRGQARGRV